MTIGRIRQHSLEERSDKRPSHRTVQHRPDAFRNLAKVRAEATRFALDLSLPFTNNEGERSLRMAKLHKKISGCFQALQ